MNTAEAETRPQGPVLIIEDDASLRESIAELLEMEGYDVECARNGREALDQLRHVPVPCLIILDLMMPVMDGWEFRRRQKSDPALPDIPVLVISGAWNMGPQGEVPDADAYLVKPFGVEEFLATVERLCDEMGIRSRT
jgi:CheY-like chemotaxis protein